jgi:hypothetical protein
VRDTFIASLLTLTLPGALGCQAKPEQAAAEASAKAGVLDRSVLPIPEPTYPPITELDARKATRPPHFEINAAKAGAEAAERIETAK